MKSNIITIIIAFSVLFAVGRYNVAQAQTNSPVATPTLEAPQPPEDEAPAEPTPIPPTLLELILQVIQELGGELTLAVLAGIGVVQKSVVSWVRRLFPNDEGTATKINGGVAQVFAGVSAIALALIAWGVTFVSGYVSGIDLAGIATGAIGIWFAGFGVHKLDKVSKLTNLLKEMSA